MDRNYHLSKNKYIKRQIYITCSRPPPTLQKIGPHKGIEFADFDVYKAWQFSKYYVRRDPIFEVERLMDTHHVKEVGGATSQDSSRSQLASDHKASVSYGLLMGEILFLWL